MARTLKRRDSKRKSLKHASNKRRVTRKNGGYYQSRHSKLVARKQNDKKFTDRLAQYDAAISSASDDKLKEALISSKNEYTYARDAKTPLIEYPEVLKEFFPDSEQSISNTSPMSEMVDGSHIDSSVSQENRP
jgi:hypothetical protein